MLVFPRNGIGRYQTINMARGCRSAIKSLDLTLECIRRFYAGERSPLSDVLDRYSSFFDLFEDMAGYSDFFLLQDAFVEGSGEVRFVLPFDDFQGPAVPGDLDEYRQYRERSIQSVHARNRRIQQWAAAASPASAG